MTNTTSGSTTTEQTTIGQILASLIGSCICAFSILTLEALSRCTAMNKRIRILAQFLTVSNIMICLSIILTVVINTSWLRHISFVCKINFGLSRSSVMLNIFVITVVVIDRFFCIHFPRKYLIVMTKRLLSAVYIAAWLLAIVMSSVSIPDTTDNCAAPYRAKNGIMIAMAYLGCVAIVFVVYASIIINIRKHVNKIRSLNQPAHFSGRRMYKSTLNISVVILVFICCYLPAACYRLWLFIKPEAYNYTNNYRSFVNFSYFLGVAMSPATYIWVFPQYRLHMMRIICQLNKKKTDEIDKKIAVISAPYLEIGSNFIREPIKENKPLTQPCRLAEITDIV